MPVDMCALRFYSSCTKCSEFFIKKKIAEIKRNFQNECKLFFFFFPIEKSAKIKTKKLGENSNNASVFLFSATLAQSNVRKVKSKSISFINFVCGMIFLLLFLLHSLEVTLMVSKIPQISSGVWNVS